MQTVDGRLVVICGKSRSGKSAYTAQAVKDHPRVIAWDAHGQWCELPGWRGFTSIIDFHKASQTRSAVRLAFVPGSNDDIKKRFDQFCRISLQFGVIFGPCAVIAEEQADVSTPGKAVGSWGGLLREALKRGIDVYAISQRWAEADKTAINNASEVVCFQMMPMDVEYMAKRCGIPAHELAALRKVETARGVTLPYIRLDLDRGEIVRDKLQFKKK